MKVLALYDLVTSLSLSLSQNTLRDGGYIYKGKYEGWYSVPDEAFLSPAQVTDGMEPGTKVRGMESIVVGVAELWFLGFRGNGSHGGMDKRGKLHVSVVCIP